MSETLPPGATSPPVAGGELPRARKRILVADDDDALREFIGLALRSAGYRVDAVGDGRQALDFLTQNDVDLVVTDLCMPRLDGIELAIALRKSRPTVPVIAISGGAVGQTESILHAVKLLGAKRTLPKPFPLQDLMSAVAEVVGGATY